MILIKQALTIILAILLSCLLWELIISNTIAGSRKMKEYPNFGKRPVSGSKYIWSKEGYGIVQYNNYGFLGEDINNPKKQGVIRFLFLGDSHTEALQVMPEKNFISFFKKYIHNLNPQRTIECINAGDSGNSIANYIYYAECFKNEFQMDYVVIQVTDNDFYTDALSKDNPIRLEGINDNIHVIYEPDNSSIKRSSFYKVYRFIIQRSALLQLLKNKLTDIATKKKASIINKLHKKSSNSENKDNVLTQEYEKYAKWSINMLYNKYGGKFCFLYFPYTPEIKDGRVVFGEDIPNKYKTILIDICKDYHIKFIDMTPEFDNLYRKTKIFPRGLPNNSPFSGHLNQFGHKIVGKRLAEYYAGVIE